MITKIGNELVKEANIAPYIPVVGQAYEAHSNLSDKERAALTNYYGLDNNAWLGARSLARTGIGAGIGALGGLASVNALNIPATMLGGKALPGKAKWIGAGLGALMGNIGMSGKYTQDNAQKILNKQYGVVY